MIAWFNRAAEQITGFSKEEVLGKPCRSILQTDLCGTDACPLEQTFRQHKNVANLEVVITNKWGRQIPVSVSTAPIKDKEGKILGAVETFRDLSIIKAYQLEAEERYSFKNIVTNNTRMLAILHHLKDLALSDSPGSAERRERHGEGTACPGHPRAEPPKGRPLHRRQLRRHSGHVDRIRAFWIPKGRFHGCETSQAGQVRPCGETGPCSWTKSGIFHWKCR